MRLSADDGSLPPPSAEDLAAFAAFARERVGRNARWKSIFVAATCAFWLPLEIWAFREVPLVQRAFIYVRLLLIANNVLAYVVVAYLPWAQRRAPEVGLCFGFIDCVLLGASVATQGGFEQPWIMVTYIACFGTVLLPLPLGQRVVATAAAALLLIGSYCAGHPEYLAHPYAIGSLSFFCFVAAFSVGVGHWALFLQRRAFLQSLALDRHNATLEARVAEQTRDLRLLSTHLNDALEAERARISREIHDDLGQELTAMRFALAATRRRLGSDGARVETHLGDLERLLARTTMSARSVVHDLRPKMLDDLGLYSSLEWLIERTSERTGLACRLAGDREAGPLPERVALSAFRIAQESINNALKHANALRIEVDLTLGDGALRLRISDDGVGMPCPQERRKGGLGIVGMRERAQALGGELTVAPGTPRGTVVQLRLPLSAEAAESA